MRSARCIEGLTWADWEHPAVDNVVEVAFYTILLLHFLFERSFKLESSSLPSSESTPRSSRIFTMTLNTLLAWYRQLSRSILWWQRVRGCLRSVESTKTGLAISSLFLRSVFRLSLMCNLATFHLFIRIPRTISLSTQALIAEAIHFRRSICNCFPRRIRSCTKHMEKLKKQIWLEADIRVEKLVKSFNYLQEELLYKHSSRERRSIKALHTADKHLLADNNISEVKQKLWTSLKCARSTELCRRNLTEEVEVAIRPTENEDEDFWPMNWANYKRMSIARKAWGSYLESDPSIDFLPEQSKVLRRLFAPEHITKAFTMDIMDGVRCTISGADTGLGEASVKISINRTLSRGLKVELGVDGSIWEPGEGIDVRVIKSEGHSSDTLEKFSGKVGRTLISVVHGQTH